MTVRSSSFRYSVLMVLSTFLSIIGLSLPVHAQTLEWVRQFGTNRVDEGLAVAKAPHGVYVSGHTIGVFPGETAAGLNDVDAFLARYDEQANAVWVRQFGSTTVAHDRGVGAAAD